jgi:formylglycine-generating enzyme required for sulfatase activity
MEAMRRICQDEPRPPSTITHLIDSEVETILLKAMSKERDRRYVDAGELAEDLRRYLEGEPITARPPSAIYRLRKLARRHRPELAGMALAGAGALLIVSLALFGRRLIGPRPQPGPVVPPVTAGPEPSSVAAAPGPKLPRPHDEWEAAGVVPSGAAAVAFHRNSIGMLLVPIPSGTFMMGASDERADLMALVEQIPGADYSWYANETPRHQVTISEPFFMSAHEVTQDQYETVMGTNPAHFRGPRRPVERVSWPDAMAFCERLSELEGVTYRLPTEAQWEYACRAGTSTRFNFGGEYSPELLNCNPRWESGTGALTQTVDVGSYPPNPWGLYDMHGNVGEWCLDGQRKYQAEPATDPVGPTPDDDRVLRGGSHSHYFMTCRAGDRGKTDLSTRSPEYGFRVIALTSTPVEAG